MQKHIKPLKLLNKNFFLLWQGQFVTLIGNNIFNIAIIFWLKHQTGSASLMGLLMMASMIPFVIFGPVSGVLADRYSRWRIMIFSDLIRGILIISFAIMVFLMPVVSGTTITSLFVISIISGIIGSAFNPAVNASIPQLVPSEKLTAANSMIMFSQSITNTIGQGIGGVLFRILGAPFMFLINGIAFLYSSATILFIKIPQEFSNRSTKTKIDNILQDFKEGLKFIFDNRGMMYLYIQLSIIMFFIMPLMVLFPFYIEDYLKATSDWYGYLMAGGSIGTMIGYIIAGGIKVPGHTRSKMFIIFFIILLLSWTGFGIITDKIIALIIMTFCGILQGIIVVNVTTIIQQTTPDWIRGRVLSVLSTIIIGLVPLGMGLIGIVTDLLDKNIQLMFILFSSISIVVVLIFSFNRQYRKFLSYEHAGNNNQVKQ